MRVQFQKSIPAGWSAGGILKPAMPPAGYTRHTAVTEWLTLNCLGAWASQSRSGWIEVHFDLASDHERARDHFKALSQWRSKSPSDV